MKRLSVLAGVAMLLASANLASVALAGDKDKLEKTEYFPLKVGNTWEYLTSGKKIVVTVKAHEMVSGMLCAKVETDLSGVLLTEHITVKDGGVYRVQANGKKVEPPFLILKVPPKAGESWTNKSSLEGFIIEGTMTVAEEKNVKVGSKDYDTLFLVSSSNLKVGGQDAVMKTWFARDVGMVKQIFQMSGSNIDVTVELDKFTAGK
jgi:hypothetical protein